MPVGSSGSATRRRGERAAPRANAWWKVPVGGTNLDVEFCRYGADRTEAQAPGQVDVRGMTVRCRCSPADGEELLKQRRTTLIDIDGNPATVVGDRRRAVPVELDIDPVNVTRQPLVEAVADDLEHDVGDAGGADGAEPHARALPDIRQVVGQVVIAHPVMLRTRSDDRLAGKGALKVPCCEPPCSETQEKCYT